jgi:regulator of replication initiation timing
MHILDSIKEIRETNELLRKEMAEIKSENALLQKEKEELRSKLQEHLALKH